MIVVVGEPGAEDVRILAAGVIARGGRCEVVGAVRPGPAGDAVLRSLATLGVGHAAVLRTPAPTLDAADLELALRYLPDAHVVVVLAQDGLAATAAAAAAWSGAAIAIVTAAPISLPQPETLPVDDRTIVLAPPPNDRDGAFAGLVAELAVRLDAGEAMADAWPAALGATGAAPLVGNDGSAR